MSRGLITESYSVRLNLILPEYPSTDVAALLVKDETEGVAGGSYSKRASASTGNEQ